MSMDSLKLIVSLVLLIVVVFGFWQFCKRLSNMQVFLNFCVLFVVSYFSLDNALIIGSVEVLVGIVLWRKKIDEYSEESC